MVLSNNRKLLRTVPSKAKLVKITVSKPSDAYFEREIRSARFIGLVNTDRFRGFCDFHGPFPLALKLYFSTIESGGSASAPSNKCTPLDTWNNDNLYRRSKCLVFESW